MRLQKTRVACLAVGSALLLTACGDDDGDKKAAQTITNIVVDSGDFDTLEAALVAADLADTLAGDGPFTVFAPTDAAFDKLPAGALDALLADTEALSDVLLYHVVSGRVDAATVVTLDKATTLQGDDVTIEVVGSEVILNGTVKVTTTDIEADNGIIHVIDAVLMPPEDPEPQTITDVVVGSSDFDTLEAAVIAAELDDDLAGAGPFTVFAPTDAAFAALPAGALDDLLADKEALADVLLYHVVSGRVDAATVVTLDEATTLQGDEITIEVVGGEVILNGSVKVTTTDIAASNGIIHVIDAVLMPPEDPAPQTITDVVVGSSDFDTLEAAVVAAGLADDLAGTGPFTVFAPTDAAFEALPAGALDDLLADTDALADVLLYHVVSGRVDAATVVTLDEATTLQGDKITIEVVGGEVILNGSVKVTMTDVAASNGIIHVIDAVLMPPEKLGTITDIVVAGADFETLETALTAAGLADDLAGAGPFTVFAPTDDAIAALGSGTLQALLADLPKLTDILLYHVVDGRVDAATVVTLDEATAKNGAPISIAVVGGKVILNGTVEVTTTDIAASNGIIHVIDAVLLPPETIAGIVAADARFSTLETALGAADLDTVLAGAGPFTVFAPTDAAFALVPAADLQALLADTTALSDVLLYHVVSGLERAEDVVAATHLVMENGAVAPISTAGGAKIGGVVISATDIRARNGIIHVIDAVLMPPPTIAEIVSENQDFETLLSAVGAAGLADELSGDALFTVFAPTDAAFAKIPAADLTALVADVPKLTDVLLYHAVAGVVPASVAVTLTTATMVNGDTTAIAFDAGTSTLTINGAKVTTADVWARNGVIHIIDTVILPPM